MDEVWKPIPSYEREYEVSTLGRVRSLDRLVSYSNGKKVMHKKGKLLRGHHCDYTRVKLSGETAYVHRLVMASFVGACPEGMEVAHNDGNAANNRLDNLRYATASENAADKIAHGTAVCSRGEKHGGAKLTELDALAIATLAPDYSNKEIGRVFGVTDVMVYYISTGKSWKHLFQ